MANVTGYYRILEKTRKSKAKYGSFEAGDIMVISMRLTKNRIANIYMLVGDQYQRVSTTTPGNLGDLMTEDALNEHALYYVEQIVAPGIPALNADTIIGVV